MNKGRIRVGTRNASLVANTFSTTHDQLPHVSELIVGVDVGVLSEVVSYPAADAGLHDLLHRETLLSHAYRATAGARRHKLSIGMVRGLGVMVNFVRWVLGAIVIVRRYCLALSNFSLL